MITIRVELDIFYGAALRAVISASCRLILRVHWFIGAGIDYLLPLGRDIYPFIEIVQPKLVRR